MRNLKKMGFTLVEILVTIAIIGILAAIIVVGIQSSRTKAKNGAIKSAFTKARLEVNDANYSTAFTPDAGGGDVCEAMMSTSFKAEAIANGALYTPNYKGWSGVPGYSGIAHDEPFKCSIPGLGRWVINVQVASGGTRANGSGGMCYDSEGKIGDGGTANPIQRLSACTGSPTIK